MKICISIKEYKMLETFCDKLKVKDDDFVLMTGNFIKFLKKLKNYDKNLNLNLFLDKLIKRIGGGGLYVFKHLIGIFALENLIIFYKAKLKQGYWQIQV